MASNISFRCLHVDVKIYGWVWKAACVNASGINLILTLIRTDDLGRGSVCQEIKLSLHGSFIKQVKC